MQNQIPTQEQFVDFFRHGMKTAADVTRASLQTGLKLQEKQLELVRGIIEDNAACTDGLRQASSFEELVSLQTRLAGAQMQRVAEFWSTVWQAAAENQKALIGQVQAQAGQFVARSAEDVAKAAATQISRAAGSIRESAPAHHGKAEHRKSA